MYEYTYAKKDRDNIDDAELASFRKLAKIYSEFAESKIAALLDSGGLVEICHAEKT